MADAIECTDCGLRQKRVALGPKQAACCAACGVALYREKPGGVQAALALTVAAFLLLAIANLTDFMTFEFKGRSQGNEIITGVIGLAREGYWPLGVLIFFASVPASGQFLRHLARFDITLLIGCAQNAAQNSNPLRALQRETPASSMPVLFDLDVDHPLLPVMDEIERFADEQGIANMSLLPSYMGMSAPGLWLSPLDQHPNEEAHEIAAESVHDFLLPRLRAREVQAAGP